MPRIVAVDGEIAADDIALAQRLRGLEILRESAGRICDVIADRNIAMQALRNRARDACRENVIGVLHERDRIRIERIDSDSVACARIARKVALSAARS